MASIIDNRSKTMLESLKNSLKQAESVDILTAFFYFSGFNALAEELKDKKIRILVGNTIDPDAIADLCNAVKDSPEETLETYAVRGYNKLNNSQKKNRYIDSFVGLFNKSSLSEEFDSTDSQKVFKMFLDKIENGTLEIRLTSSQNHAKAYILTNKPEYSCFGDQKGVVFTGSSNFTYNGLRGQGEMNERFSDNVKYDEYIRADRLYKNTALAHIQQLHRIVVGFVKGKVPRLKVILLRFLPDAFRFLHLAQNVCNVAPIEALFVRHLTVRLSVLKLIRADTTCQFPCAHVVHALQNVCIQLIECKLFQFVPSLICIE